jgi:hypothetical protein
LSLTRPGGFNAMTPWRTVGADVYSDLEVDYRFKHALMAERVVANASCPHPPTNSPKPPQLI